VWCNRIGWPAGGSDPVHVGLVGPENPGALATHRQIALEAWRIELTTPRTVMESYAVLRVGAAEVAQHRDGLTLLAPIPVALARLGLFDRSKVPASGGLRNHQPGGRFRYETGHHSGILLDGDRYQ